MKAEIIVGKKTSKDYFSYKIPEIFFGKLLIGSIVEVEFGNKKIFGVVAEISHKKNVVGHKLKEILAINEDFFIDPAYIEIAKWVSNYYFCTLGEAISLFLPPRIKRPRKQKVMADSAKNVSKLVLNSEQEKILNRIVKNFASSKKIPHLIFGVTGSGKTEIYLALAKKILEQKKSVVILVPEIVLTPQNISRFKKIFANQVTIMHSKLSKSEKYYCYRDFYSGLKKIIIGPRSALLIPNRDIGLVIIDEEQEESYKQDQNPRYDAIKLAEKITGFLGANLVLGSATPKIETFYQAQEGIYDFHQLSKRFHQPDMPVAKIIDMRQEIKRGNNSILSEYLQQRIKNVIDGGGQIILFLNRKGMSTFVSCRDCGEVIFCKYCDVPMVYHIGEKDDYLHCHHCDKIQKVPKNCPNCKSMKIKFFGSGTERLEREVIKLFPWAKTKRVDSSEFKNISDYESFYENFSKRKYDIVIGTQILAKGFDIPGVELVGIVSADVGLHLPYFRASEKVFRLITQVSGRSGRRTKAGETVIQTYWPQSEAIKYASKHDYKSFYEIEIKKRFEKNYPPRTHIVRIVSENKNQQKAKKIIEKLAKDLTDLKFNFIGPGQCFFSKISNRYRFQLLIKVDKLPDTKLIEIRQKYKNLIWDSDPVNIL